MASPGEEMPGREELVGWGIEPGGGHRVVTKGRHALSACCSLNTIAILTTLPRSKRFCSPRPSYVLPRDSALPRDLSLLALGAEKDSGAFEN
jgi:hypothetical protein